MAQYDRSKPVKWPGLIFAIQFLTVIPVSSRHPFNARTALPFFPICGLLIGIALAGVDLLAGLAWPRPVVAVIDILLLAFISGALHLDGLADTADGLYGKRDPDQALAIMKDSRIGSMGMIAVVCCLAVKWVGMWHIQGNPAVWLIVVPAFARASVLIGSWMLPYGRSEDGTGHAFFKTPLSGWDFWGMGPILLLALMLGWKVFTLIAGFALIVFGLLSWYRRKIQCITGDMLGAMIEITEAGLFLAAAIHWGG